MRQIPNFVLRGKRNNNNYELNRDIMEKIDEALNSVDADEWSAKLNKGKDLFLKRNKHILCDGVTKHIILLFLYF